MATLTRQQILGSKSAAKMVRLDAPFWGGSINVKELTGKERDQFEAVIIKEREKAKKADKDYKPNVRGLMLALCVCDDAGNPIFELEDAEKIGEFPAWQLQAIVENADQLNRFSEKEKEELEKKFENRGGSGSAADSPTDGEKTPKNSTSESPPASSKPSGRSGR